ncbi:MULTISPECIES: hypothetical protein [Rhizobium/Agrobacterium group]|uniref:Phosphohydrolase n=1 Tax=Allorhizobium ampelinum (strain ATCC BAA-846 / DSM 112012 / S4) TaxID=311402 RepID=B9K2Q0_ALLAM|nr:MULTISPECIES: hypothetical protein [Rhizobium/Agrobacterium group]ACM39148.1 conserved hypothetical protein [Allorhizobium ampelinum S4]
MESTEVIAQGEDRRHGDWMQTYSGRKFWPCDPRPEEIHIEDIAHALSMACRYGGHCNHFYSVAEHCVLISHQVRSEDALWGLLHDAAEAYISDIIRPVKPHLSNYKAFETNLMTAICLRFGLPLVTPESVRWADEAILGDELSQVMGKPPEPWGLRYRPIGVEIHGWFPQRAEKEFLERFYQLAPRECPICATPFKPEDICATDVEMGTCHAACLEGSPVVDLDSGDVLPDGEVDTFQCGDAAEVPQ